MSRKWNYFTDQEVEGLEEEFVAKLEKARHEAQVPFVITSGRRLPDQNDSIGGVKDSAHLQGRAVDLRSRDSHTHYRILKGAILAGFNRIGIYHDHNGQPTHIHIDDSTILPQDVCWTGESK